MRVKFADVMDDAGGNANRLSGSGTWTAVGLVIVSVAIGLALVLIKLALHLPVSDMAALATFLAISGGSPLWGSGDFGSWHGRGLCGLGC